MFEAQEPLWSVVRKLRNEESAMSSDDRMVAREFRKQIQAHNSKHNVPKEVSMTAKVLGITAGEKIGTSWMNINKDRDTDKQYVQVIRVQPTTLNNEVRKFMPEQGNQTQFPLTQSQVDNYVSNHVSPRVGSVMEFQVEAWVKDSTEYLGLKSDFKDRAALQKAFEADPTSAFEVQKHTVNTYSFKGIAAWDAKDAASVTAATAVSNIDQLMAADYETLSPAQQKQLALFQGALFSFK